MGKRGRQDEDEDGEIVNEEGSIVKKVKGGNKDDEGEFRVQTLVARRYVQVVPP